MPEMNTDANNPCCCALAIFCEGTPFYKNPLYRACFGEDFVPPPAEETPTPAFFEGAFPYVAINSLFTGEKKPYCLFAALPFSEGDARETVLARFNGMIADIRMLFSRAAERPPLRTVSMETLFRTVCLLAEEEFSLPFYLSGDTPEMHEHTRVDKRGLLMALGILLPPMVTDGGAEICLQRNPHGWQMIWRGGLPPTHPFLRRLAALLCESSGVFLAFEADAFSLFFPIHHPKVLSLRTPSHDRIDNCLRLGFYLGE